MVRICVFVIVVVTLVVYGRIVTHEHVLDDRALIPHQKVLDTPFDMADIFLGRYWGDLRQQDTLYRPLTIWSLALNRWENTVLGVSGDHPFVYRITSVLLHAGVSVLMFVFARWLGLSDAVSFLGGMLFAVFAVMGLAYGVGTGGNLNIGLWEARPLFYMVLMLVLASNLLTERSHFSHLMWAAMLAIFVESAAGVHHFVVDLGMSLAGVESVTEHAAAIHMNTLFVYILAVWLFKASAVKRIVLPLMVPFVGVTYLITQRRAAFVTLAVALLLFAIILFMENRKLFWIVVPPMAVIAMLYTGAFWNNTGTLGIPAQAIKSVIAEDQASAADASSNIYRIIENLNTSFTIHQKPLTGVGFGQKFYVVVPMPDISFFEWWEYLPHNSVIWIWLKMGVGGFVATVALIGLSIMVGVRAFLRMPKNDLAAIALTAVLYLVMHFTFAYVDISWDTQSMVYVGTVMGMLSCMERVVAKPVTPKPKRWPWQSAEMDAAPIRSLD